MTSITHVFTTLFMLAVVFGALIMVLNRPQNAVSVFASGVKDVTGIQHALSGQPTS